MSSEPATRRVAVILSVLATLGSWNQYLGRAQAETDAAKPAARAASDADSPQISESIRRFGRDLYGKLDGSNNLVVSPASISSVMAMAYSGARNRTAREMAAAMHFPAPPEKLHIAFADFDPGRRVLGYSFGARVVANWGYGLKVTEVLLESSAAKLGLSAGDLVLAINDRPIRDETDYAEAIDRSRGKLRVQWFSHRRGSVAVGEVSLAAAVGEEPPTRLEMVNAVWGQKGYDFNPGYIDLIKTHYHGHFAELDFAAQPDASRQHVNQWIFAKTHRRVRNLLGRDAVTDDSRLVLTNTLYFKGLWQRPFATHEPGLEWRLDGRPDGAAVRVPAMAQTDVFRYTQTPLYQAVELPYQESSLSLVLVLPDAKLPWSEFQTALEKPDALAGLENLKPTRVRLQLPKFRIATTLSLKDLLEPGMPEAFSEKADFSGMSAGANLKISTVVHMAYITVDEEGTEAGAATAATITLKTPPDAEFIANRPFLFLLHHRPTQTPLFLGHLINPTK